MSEKGEQIIRKYPNLFKMVSRPYTETCMCWGIETGDGWLDIIDKLCEFLTEHKWLTSVELFDQNGMPVNVKYSYPHVVFDQIKEKFGTLRIYYHIELPEFKSYIDISTNNAIIKKIADDIDQYVNGVINFIEFLSGKICEVTGKPGQLRIKGGWYKTVCDEIAEKEGYAINKDS